LKVLLITFSFPPIGGVGVLRALSLARYLPLHGIEVTVLTAKNAPAVSVDPLLLQQLPEVVEVQSTWTLDLPFRLRKAVKKFVSKRGAPAPVAKPSQGTKKQPLMRRLIADLLLPDPQIGWLPFVFPRAVRLIRARKIDLVLITVPPFSCARLVTKLRHRFPALPIVIDFRDEWLTSTIHLVSFNRSERARRVAQTVESEAVRDATAVVAVTPAAQRELRNRYPNESAGKFYCIPNGFQSEPPSATRVTPIKKDGRVIVTFLGSVYGSTDPSTFVAAVRAMPDELRSRMLFRFIGHVETAAWRASLLSLGETVELKGFVPQAEALRAMDDTTYLLLISHDPINVSAKLYDYLGGAKPILAVAKPEGDVRRLLEETRAGWWADSEDVPAITRLFVDAIENAPQLEEIFQPDLSTIATFHRAPLAAKYADLLHSLMEEKR
jgi:hypothetical protein